MNFNHYTKRELDKMIRDGNGSIAMLSHLADRERMNMPNTREQRIREAWRINNRNFDWRERPFWSAELDKPFPLAPGEWPDFDPSGAEMTADMKKELVTFELLPNGEIVCEGIRLAVLRK